MCARLLIRLSGLEGSESEPLIYQLSTYKGLRYTAVQAMGVEVTIFGGGCSVPETVVESLAWCQLRDFRSSAPPQRVPVARDLIA
jgi:hypothetical protein